MKGPSQIAVKSPNCGSNTLEFGNLGSRDHGGTLFSSGEKSLLKL